QSMPERSIFPRSSRSGSMDKKRTFALACASVQFYVDSSVPFVLHSGRKQPPVIRDQIVFRFGPRPDFLAKKTVVLNNPAIIRDDIRHSFSCLYFSPPEPGVQRPRLLILLSRTLERSLRSIISFYSHL